LANKSVVLYQSVKVKAKWTFLEVVDDLPEFSKAQLYVSWYEGKDKRMTPVGRDSKHALKMLNKKRAELAYKNLGGEIKESAECAPSSPDQNGSEGDVSNEVKKYLADCKDREGESGYGLGKRTSEAYEYRLGFLVEFSPKASVSAIDLEFMKQFLRFLRNHKRKQGNRKLGDRTCYNIMQAVSTFLISRNNNAAKLVLKGISFPPTEVIPYPDEEMQRFFEACTKKEELLFKFFLHSMARDMEVAHCEVRDLKFDVNVLHISPKPGRNFRLKGKRSGQAKKGRKVPIPAAFMARMKKYCADKGPTELLFPNRHGGIDTHFLDKCKRISRKACLVNWRDFDLHRWRKTGATRHHEDHVSVRKIQSWLGHESLEETLAYLGIVDAADEVSQEQVNTGALAEFV
jgi:integrase